MATNYMRVNPNGVKWLDTQQMYLDEAADAEDMRGLQISAAKKEMGRLDQEQAREDDRFEWEKDTRNRELALQEEQSKASAKLAETYLAQWNTHLGETKNMFNKAIAGTDKAFGYLDSAKGAVGKIDAFADDVMSQWSSYKEKFSPLEQEGIDASRESLGVQRGLTRRYEDLSTADYEGAAGRAKADVRFEAENARKAEDRRLMSLGVDPTSKKFRGMQRRNRNDEVLAMVGAAGRARREEKQRVTDVTAQGLQVINPNVGANIALGIRGQDQELMGIRGDAITRGLTARTDIAKSAGDISGAQAGIGRAYSQAVTQPVGELGAGMLGLNMATGPKGLQTKKFT